MKSVPIKHLRAAEDYWQVTDDNGRCWIAHKTDRNGWFITNESLRLIVPSGALGRRIVRAIEKNSPSDRQA